MFLKQEKSRWREGYCGITPREKEKSHNHVFEMNRGAITTRNLCLTNLSLPYHEPLADE